MAELNPTLDNSLFSAEPEAYMLAPQAEPMLVKARRVLEMEAEAIMGVSKRLSLEFEKAIELLAQCQGKVVVTGMGKSGHIGCKLAASFASTGTPAFFVHPAEMRHGDFGMLDERDLVLVLSSSGETQEVKLVLDHLKRLGVKIISLTGNINSTLAKFSDVVIDVTVEREACPFNLAPTSSTTAALAAGDALVIVLMERKGFRVEDFAKAHPGGSLGLRLILVRDIMRSGVMVPSVKLDADYEAILMEVDRKRLGFTAVVNAERRLVGVITDGDLRRSHVKHGKQVFAKEASEIMTANPKTIPADALAVEAIKLMEKHSIHNLLIVDEEHRPVGILDVHDVFRAGIL